MLTLAVALGMATSSPMRSYREKLSPQELADVVSYLATVKGQTN